MRRKKVENNTDYIEGIPELEENEQFVIEDTRKVRKEKTAPPETVIEAEPDGGEPEFEPFNEPEFSETSLAALIYKSEDEPIENQFCTVMVRRNPDSMTDRFLTPCGSVMTLPPLRNIELSAEKSDIEERVRHLHGGGHYFFQIHFNNRLTSSWKVTLSDSPEAVAESKVEKPSETPAPSPVEPPPAVNPIDNFLETLEKQKRMKDLLFGDEMRELEELRRRALEVTPAPPVTKSELATILDYADKAGPNLQERLLEMAFPAKDETSSHWLVDLVKVGFEHKAELAGLAQMLLGGIAQPPPQGIESLLRAQPPAGQIPPPVASVETTGRSKFRRKPIAATVEPEPDTENKEENEQPND